MGDEPETLPVQREPERVAKRRTRRRAEISAGILLAFATVLAAWAGFQNAQWVRERFDVSDQSTSVASDASELRISADLDEQWDQSIFASWASALIDGREVEAIAYESLFRDAARPLLDSWVRAYAQDPAAALENGPFESDVYDVAQRRAQASVARGQARALSRESRSASQNGSHYALLMVFFAGALTFVGLTALFHERRVRWLTLGLAAIAVVGGLLLMLQLPILL